MAKQELRGKLKTKSQAQTGGFAPPPGANKVQMPNTPIPAGAVYKVTKPTATEEAALAPFGWKNGDAIPADLAERLAEAEKIAAATFEDIQPPVPLDTPPLAVPEPVAFGSLSQDKQAEIRAAIEQAKSFAAAAEAPQPNYSSEVASTLRQLQVEDDTRASVYAGTATPKAPTKAEPVAAVAEMRSGAAPPMTDCPHCGWELSRPSPLEPTQLDKRSFQQSILGDIPFKKEYKIIGGAYKVTLRSLLLKEIDQCHVRTRKDLAANEIPDNSYYDQVMKYRIALQVVEISVNGEVVHSLPESLETWVEQLNEAGIGGDRPIALENALPAIAEYMFDNVLTTESVGRCVNECVYEFNRLTAKMETNAQNEDFWLATHEGH